MLGPSLSGPSLLGLSLMGLSLLGPSLLGPSLLGPSLLGPSLLGLSLLGPSLLGPSLGPSLLGPSLLGLFVCLFLCFLDGRVGRRGERARGRILDGDGGWQMMLVVCDGQWIVAAGLGVAGRCRGAWLGA